MNPKSSPKSSIINRIDEKFNFLLHSFDATGHVLPMQAVAHTLVAQGHRVVWLSSMEQRSRVISSGATFVEAQEVTVVNAALKAANPQSIEECVDALFGGRVLAQVADCRSVLASFSVDCLLIDALPQGGSALYDLGEVPFYVTLGVVPMYTSSADLETGTKTSSLIHEAASALGTILSNPNLVLPTINSQRSALGIHPLTASDVLHYSPFLHIQASCALLELKDTSLPSPMAFPVHYVGPLVSSTNPASHLAPSWWADVISSPCVIGVTQGTFAVDPSLLLIPAMEALSKESDLLLVVPSPHADDIRQKTTVADNVRLADWVPYELFIPRCKILITNGGYGSVTQALSHGVPIICAGTTEDKKDTAARVTWLGAGIDLGTSTPSSVQIRDAVKEILVNTSYAENAKRVGKELSRLGGAQKVCQLLEQAVRQNSRSRNP